MIAVYAQARVSQGIEAAMNGQPVMSDDVVFDALRRRSIALNLKREPIKVGTATVRIGMVIARLQFESSVAEDDSPIVVVLESRALERNIKALADAVLGTADAIDRRLERSAVEQALEAAASAMRTKQVHQLIALCVVVGAAALATSVLRRRAAATRLMS